MSSIPTWHERAMRHPDHQSGMVSKGMIRARMAEEIADLRAEIERLRTVYVLIASREAGPVDSATCWYEDKIIGCYISREVAEGAAKLLMEDWRINEYALEAKP